MGILNVTKDNYLEKISDKALLVFCDNKKKSSRIYTEILERVSKQSDILILKYDIKTQDKLITDLGIMSVPTTIFFKDGKVHKKYVGIRTESELLETTM